MRINYLRQKGQVVWNDHGEPANAARRDREVASVANAMRLIEALGRADSSGVTQIAAELDLSKPSVDRLLSTLLTSGYVEQMPDSRKYRLTMKLVAVANSVKDRTGLIDLARPHLLQLADEFSETVNLGTLHQGHIVYADSVPSRQIFRIEPRPGSENPAHATAMGKAVLANSEPDVLDRYLREFRPLPFTPNTVTTVAELRARLDAVRERGYALDEGELLEEVYCVAAPVLQPDGHAIAAISVTTIRSTFARIGEQITKSVVSVGSRLSEEVSNLR